MIQVLGHVGRRDCSSKADTHDSGHPANRAAATRRRRRGYADLSYGGPRRQVCSAGELNSSLCRTVEHQL
jgi:hypothetical protein